MPQVKDTSIIAAIMTEFADRSGLAAPTRQPRRYLWTDAFAVCNFLELFRKTGRDGYLLNAITLVKQVHTVLGRHREDDPRSGWISGLEEREGVQHPTQGGLRIGKEMNERGPEEIFDEHQEWERDGQYFHYLTKWMHALNCLTRVTGDSSYNRWALECAKTAYARFTYMPWTGGPKRLHWKMSIDLSRPLVPSTGQYDPLDGLITYTQIQMTAEKFSETPAESHLAGEIADLTAMCEGMDLATDDPLEIGGLLTDAYRLAQLMISSHLPESERLISLLRDAEHSLDMFVPTSHLNAPAEYRLAFRELGLSIGLHTIGKILETIDRHPGSFSHQQQLNSGLAGLARFLPLSQLIESFWLDPDNQQSSAWTAHGDINHVMLATSLGPDGYLVLP